jgi:type IV pilus assembly protein PilB
MVGEIRDGETADLGIQAALTGHLVLSTLHTNNAATTLPRLLDMGAEPFLIASTVKVVVGQRLVRKLCPNCHQEFKPNEQEIAKLKQQFQIEFAIKQLAVEQAHQSARAVEQKNKTTAPGANKVQSLSDLTLWRAGKGCETCGGSGYKGRMGIYEVLEVSEAISKLIISNAVSDAIQKQGIAEGMITMHNDGLIKALLGLTTIEEVLRVTRE